MESDKAKEDHKLAMAAACQNALTGFVKANIGPLWTAYSLGVVMNGVIDILQKMDPDMPIEEIKADLIRAFHTGMKNSVVVSIVV